MDRHRHEPVIRSDVEKFFPVRVPVRLRAALGGHTDVRARAGKRPDIDFVLARSCSDWYAIHFPSGENCASPSENSVSTTANGW